MGQIFYGEKNGGFFQGENDNIPSEYNPVDQDWYKLAQAGHGEIIWTEPYFNYMTQEIVVTAAKPVIGLNGLQGVIAIDFNLVRNE